jgi:hypothetical protein
MKRPGAMEDELPGRNAETDPLDVDIAREIAVPADERE